MTVLIIGACLAGSVATMELAQASACVVLVVSGERPMDACWPIWRAETGFHCEG